jgi:hypothetical protein
LTKNKIGGAPNSRTLEKMRYSEKSLDAEVDRNKSPFTLTFLNKFSRAKIEFAWESRYELIGENFSTRK